MKKKTIDLAYFEQLLAEYRLGKELLQKRILAAEDYWRLRHTSLLQCPKPGQIQPASGWLVNCILSKHADAVEAYPQPVCLPREAGDEAEAKTLSKILPAILRRNDFDQVWSDVWWQKLKAGTGVYGVFWDQDRGDVAIKRVDILDLYWEPGVEDLQQSGAVFCLSRRDTEGLIREYPQLKGFQGSQVYRQRYTDEPGRGEKESTVVDVYYKRNGCLHYLKYVGKHILFATEGNKDFPNGLYNHGQYPFVLDGLFPEEGYPGCGYGYVDLCRDAQNVVDILSSCFIKNALASATPRWFIRTDGNIDEKEYADFTKPFVHVRGRVDGDSIQAIRQEALPEVYVDLLEMKINEIKEVAGNRDVNNGSTSPQLTAAAAITALQEAGNSLSRDMIATSYRAVRKVMELAVELIRQFYDAPRAFRILGAGGQKEYLAYDNARLKGVVQLDIQVEVEKENRYDRQEFNDLALQLYKLGVFREENRQEAQMLLQLLDLKGKSRLRQVLEENYGS